MRGNTTRALVEFSCWLEAPIDVPNRLCCGFLSFLHLFRALHVPPYVKTCGSSNVLSPNVACSPKGRSNTSFLDFSRGSKKGQMWDCICGLLTLPLADTTNVGPAMRPKQEIISTTPANLFIANLYRCTSARLLKSHWCQLFLISIVS
jgi:hypothetical protein